MNSCMQAAEIGRQVRQSSTGEAAEGQRQVKINKKSCIQQKKRDWHREGTLRLRSAAHGPLKRRYQLLLRCLRCFQDALKMHDTTMHDAQ